MLAVFLSGFALGGGLIVAIGAQNAYILRQGLLRNHVFALCLFCALSDAALIALGVAGLGAAVEARPDLLVPIRWAGAAFLFGYAALAAWRALRPEAMEAAEVSRPSLGAALATVAAFTFLNPHVYLDTVLLVGGLSASYGEARWTFGAGAMVASFVWFFGLGYGARWLAPLFEKRVAWRILDALIALVMAWLAVSLIR